MTSAVAESESNTHTHTHRHETLNTSFGTYTFITSIEMSVRKMNWCMRNVLNEWLNVSAAQRSCQWKDALRARRGLVRRFAIAFAGNSGPRAGCRRLLAPGFGSDLTPSRGHVMSCHVMSGSWRCHVSGSCAHTSMSMERSRHQLMKTCAALT